MTGSNLLVVRNLDVYLSSVGSKRQILDGVSFSIVRGTTTAIIGESGCGKSTLCKALMGLLDSQFKISGSLEWHNSSGLRVLIDPARPNEFDSLRGRRIGIVFQEAAASLNPVLPIGRQVGDLIPDSDRQAILQLLERVGFRDAKSILRAYPHELSGGQAQRVGLALALAPQPDLLIVDEPVTALDSIARQEFYQMLKNWQTENGLTIILVTHDLTGLTDPVSQLLVMSAGQIVEQGDCREILQNPSHPDTQGFVKIFTAMREGRWPDVVLSTDKCI
jgi:ABC-type dipeptide/oligopeptide/nickel transport system ATPase component